MTDPVHLFILLVVMGLMLLCVEVFVPGGVLGIFAALCMIAAIGTAFFAFPPQVAFFATGILIVGSGVLFGVWLKCFPGTRLGRRLTLQTDGKDFKSSPDQTAKYMGKTGVAQSSLRPAGIAVIDNQRIDVVAESGYIESGGQVRVIQVEGNRIVVREVKSS
jgi:membrane-bound serine protease (ClpP class)